MVKLGILVQVEAKPGKEEEVAAAFAGVLPIIQNEQGTIHWFAFRTGKSTFNVFDTFEDEAGREAHMNGEAAKALFAAEAEYFSKPVYLEKVDLFAVKTPK